MIRITFNAFSFLQGILKQKNRPYENVAMIAPDGISAGALISMAGLSEKEIESVFINGKVGSFHHVLEEGDRVSVFPQGTPGPYRMLLGMKKAG